ncbi:hypothetical protein B7759_03488 [Burkholderia glumae]|nr:hypothetical protein B7759_03488 [Burkholderia glumae]
MWDTTSRAGRAARARRASCPAFAGRRVRRIGFDTDRAPGRAGLLAPC